MRQLLEVPEVMQNIRVITSFEESKFSDIPRWDGWVANWTDKAALLVLRPLPPSTSDDKHWFPLGQLRKAADGQSVYATVWILDKKGI